FCVSRELIRCGVVVEHRVSPSLAFRKSLAVLLHHESLGKNIWHFHCEGRLRSLLQLPLELDDHGPLGERLAVTGDAGFVRVDHRGVRDDHLEYFGGSRGGDVSPVLVSPEVGERNSARRHQRVLVLVLTLRVKDHDAEDGEHFNGCRNDGEAPDTFHGCACFYPLFLRHEFPHKLRHGVFSSQIKFGKPDQRASRMIAIRPEITGVKQLDHGTDDTFVSVGKVSFLRRSTSRTSSVKGICLWHEHMAIDTKVWAIPSSNCAPRFVLAEWLSTKPMATMKRDCQTHTEDRTQETRTGSPDPTVALLLASHD